MTYVLQLHDDPHFEWSAALLRSLHFMLVEYDLDALPGRWRPGTGFVNDTATGRVVYEGQNPSRSRPWSTSWWSGSTTTTGRHWSAGPWRTCTWR